MISYKTYIWNWFVSQSFVFYKYKKHWKKQQQIRHFDLNILLRGFLVTLKLAVVIKGYSDIWTRLPLHEFKNTMTIPSKITEFIAGMKSFPRPL